MIARCSAFGLVATALVEPPESDGATGSPSRAASALRVLAANSLGVAPDIKVCSWAFPLP